MAWQAQAPGCSFSQVAHHRSRVQRLVVTSAITDEDRRHMRHALDLARRAEGQTFPNPAVGCVIIKDRQAGQGL